MTKATGQAGCGEVFELHPAQENIFYDQLLDADSPLYNLGAYSRSFRQDLQLFQQAWDLVHEKLDLLKLHLQVTAEGTPQQVILSDKTPQSILFLDFSDQDDPAAAAEIWLLDQMDQPLDYLSGEMYSLALLRLSPEESYFFTRLHHILMDGIGFYRLHELVHRLYDDLQTGNPLHWLEPQVPYEKSIREARGYLTSAEYETDGRYWQEFLSKRDIEPLPPRFADQTAGNRRLQLSQKQSAQIRNFCAENRLSVLALFMTAVSTAVAPFLEQKGLVVSTIGHGRQSKAGMVEMGMQANIFPVACDPARGQTALEQIRSVGQSLKSSFQHSRFPTAHLARLAKARGRDLPMVLVSYDRLLPTLNEERPFDFTVLEAGVPTHPLSLRLQDYSQSGDLAIGLAYSSAYLNESEAEALLGRVEKLLFAALETPDKSLSDQPLLSSGEQKLLADWNATDSPFPDHLTLPQLFETQVEKTPDGAAVIFDGREVSYLELNRRAEALARGIRQTYQARHGQSLPPATFVALFMDRSVEMVVALLAVLKAGGAYVPISPDHPEERTGFVLSDTDCPIVLTHSRHAASLRDLAGKLPGQPEIMDVDVPMVASVAPAQDGTNECPQLALSESKSRPSDPVYALYTSGTTGQPKGVVVSHRAVVNRFFWKQKTYGLKDSDRLLQNTAYTFDVSVWELLWPLCFGAAVVPVTSEQSRDPDRLHDVIASAGVTVLHFVPSMLSLFCQDLKAAQRHLSAHVRLVFCNGEVLEKQHLQQFEAVSHASTALINCYGPTEAAIDTTHFDTRQSNGTSLPIGAAIGNTQLYVLDEDRRQVPIGAPGELYIGGEGLAQGYLNRPDLTAERFVENPFVDADERTESQARLYRSGDWVRWLPDGRLAFLGRRDGQVKIRGHRIELGEIEFHLEQFSEIRQAVVIDREHQGRKQLAAYMVLQAGASLTQEQLVERLTLHLPDYMIPKSYTPLEAIPLGVSGKLARQALPEPSWRPQDRFVAPRSDLEQKLAEVWQAVLGLEEVSVFADFFLIGGDSISAIQVVTRVRRELGQEISLATLFSLKTIAALGRWLESEVPKDSLLKHLSPGSTATERFYMIHPGLSGCEVYSKLAAALSAQFDCYGIDNYNHLTEHPIADLAELAAVYCRIIVAREPQDGAIRLTGWSLGGLLALEMAYQLEQSGYRNLQVFLLDSVIETEALKELRLRYLDGTRVQQEIRSRGKEAGMEAGYIDRIVRALPLETEMSTRRPGGRLDHTEVTLFKSGRKDPRFDWEFTAKHHELMTRMPDNNVSAWVKKPLTCHLIKDRFHGDILEAVAEIKAGILGFEPEVAQPELAVSAD
ncbi:non-ribosomal peptide synthetase [Rhodovibrionaceae bacterium A322]